MDWHTALLGFGGGVLVGLTGMGGGAVMTPLLILTGWARPAVAVGTDLAWGTITKTVGAYVHYRQRTVDFTIVGRLALGSLPGALAGLALLVHLRRTGDEAQVDRFILRALGIALICVAVTLLFRSRWQRDPAAALSPSRQKVLTICTGAGIGFLVAITSVGSGSLIIASLLLLYPGTPLNRVVGSDIFHAVFLVGVASLGHWRMSSVDVPLLAGLLAGSLPGVWLGSKLSLVFPEKVLRPILATALFGMGYKLL